MQQPARGLFDACRRGPDAALGCALLAGIVPAVVWVGLTALDGRTYHLAPILVTAAPGLAARALGLRIDLVVPSLLVAGTITTGVAWAVIELVGVAPSATLWDRQPGGVGGEVAIAAIVGALVGGLAVRSGASTRASSRR